MAMDEKIRKIQRDVKRGKNKEAQKELKSLERADKKRDKLVRKAKQC